MYAKAILDYISLKKELDHNTTNTLWLSHRASRTKTQCEQESGVCDIGFR